MKVLYLDESGNHDLRNISATYPVFVIGGVIADRAYVREVIGPEMRAFKQRHFGREDIVLHTVDMGKGRGDYGFLADSGKRAAFYGELNALLGKWDYKVVACVFEKNRFAKVYTSPADLYHYGLEILIERFCLELGDLVNAGHIYAEKRNPGLDRDLLQAWDDLKENEFGTGYMTSEAIDQKIIGLELREKKPHYYGLQLADLVITPVGRHLAGHAPNPNQVQWSIVEGKLRKYRESYKGAGLIVRP